MPAKNVSAGAKIRIPNGSHVLVDCRTYNQAAAISNGGGWWYHVASGPYAGYWTPASDYDNGVPWPTPGPLVDPLGQLHLPLLGTEVASPHLGRQIVGMGVEVALGAQVGGALLQGAEPAMDRRMLMTESVILVISQ